MTIACWRLCGKQGTVLVYTPTGFSKFWDIQRNRQSNTWPENEVTSLEQVCLGKCAADRQGMR